MSSRWLLERLPLRSCIFDVRKRVFASGCAEFSPLFPAPVRVTSKRFTVALPGGDCLALGVVRELEYAPVTKGDT